MKKINKLLLCLGAFIFLSFAGCATTPRPVPMASPAESKCISACALMSDCSRPKHSDHQKLSCKTECLQTPPLFRAAVTECARKALSRHCNWEKMNNCVKGRLKPLQKQ